MGNESTHFVCKSNGFSTRGFNTHNNDSSEKIIIHSGDVVEADEQGYLWRNGICLCHKDSIVGHYHFKKIKKLKKGC